MAEWNDWDGSGKAPDGGHPMVFDVEFKSGAYAGEKATTWSDWVDWRHVKRFRVTDEATEAFGAPEGSSVQ